MNWNKQINNYTVAELKAINSIPAGKEIYVHYGNNYPWQIAGMEKVTIEVSGTLGSIPSFMYSGKPTDPTVNTVMLLNQLQFQHLLIFRERFHFCNIHLNVIFNRISSEDALNIISSRFDAQNLIFIETASDGVDLDFSQGKFNKINFDWIGNDAIDLSGSNVSMTNIKLSNIGDKLISVGENSEVIINHVEGSNSYAGIVSKDGSNIFASNISMRNVKIPFSAYKKKEEYNFPKMKLSKINVENYKIKWLKDKGSELFYEKEKVGTKTKNIIPIIYRKNLDLIKLLKNENEKNN